ncbi:MAG: hypothetical protein JRI50_00605 [Deltaproteobacteria bacterium]|nr:hypothetical protein [Deltaproteobacteria bacterium]MBW1985720.1 hypothetical protein [Deltaproteobacteria bacterium]
MADSPSKCIGRKQLRQMFNDGNYWSRALSGEFQQLLVKERHLDPLKTAEPTCTHSQMLTYKDMAGNEIARVHQYLRPNGKMARQGDLIRKD